MRSYVLINVNVGSELDIIENLKKMDAVKNANIVLGEFDVIAEVHSNDMKGLRDYIRRARISFI